MMIIFALPILQGYTPLLRLDYSEAEPLAQSAAQRGLWKLKVPDFYSNNLGGPPPSHSDYYG